MLISTKEMQKQCQKFIKYEEGYFRTGYNVLLLQLVDLRWLYQILIMKHFLLVG